MSLDDFWKRYTKQLPRTLKREVHGYHVVVEEIRFTQEKPGGHTWAQSTKWDDTFNGWPLCAAYAFYIGQPFDLYYLPKGVTVRDWKAAGYRFHPVRSWLHGEPVCENCERLWEDYYSDIGELTLFTVRRTR